ncbi:hypothetical protein OOZ51_09360 [Arthrobacter sp. MI7-26]|uniref:hypothetical protein n=1 Tax=Arthrobacter sp. MI7-26 TaxID=2993653 RepID=UPI0022499898|nr:hypothetical protein [Arthrobacter sp. MI7-26]MCX2748026.1 hypothetical protein [Arthrobacter sp. MI7-26]
MPDAEAALARVLAAPAGGADKLPPNVRSLAAARRLRNARIAGLLTMAAAAVTAGVLVATHLGSISAVPVPAGTSTIAPSASPTATASAAGTASPTATATASSAATPSSLAAVGHGECTIENLTGAMTSLERLKPVLRLVGCKAGWMSIMAPAPSDNPNPEPGDWFWIARLVNGTYVQETSLVNWAAAASNNDRLTAEQFMDKAFVNSGIPVELRTALVGSPEPGSLAALGIKTYEDRSTGYKVSFNYPAAWQLGDPGSLSLTSGPGTALTDSNGQSMARLALGETNDWSLSSCLNKAPYKILDSQPMPGLPVDPALPGQGTPRFVFVAMTSAANDGGPVQAGIGITNRIAGQDGIGCVLDLAVAGPGPLKFFSFTDRRPLGGPTWGLYKFKTMDEAAAFTQTQGYKDFKAVITSLTITKAG